MNSIIRHKRMRIALRITGLTMLVLALISSLGVGRSLAQQTGTLTAIGDGDATLLSSGWATLQPGEQIAYPFNYAGGGEVVSVWMNVVAPDTTAFEIRAAQPLTATAPLTDTATVTDTAAVTEAAPLGTGEVLADAGGILTWQGTFEEAGTYTVLVTATGDAPSQYLLNVGGPGVALPPPPPQNTATTLPTLLNVREGPSTGFAVITTIEQGTPLTVLGRNALNTWILVQLPDGTQGWVTRTLTDYTGIADLVEAPAAPSPTPDPNAPPDATPAPDETPIPGDDESLDEPEADESLSGNWRVLPAGEAAWYTFQHNGGDLPVHIWMDIQPTDGASFAIYDRASAEAIMAGGNPDEFAAIGQGTPNPTEPGYLFWRGTFEEAGEFFVLVSQNTDSDIRYSIYAAGPGLARSMPQ